MKTVSYWGIEFWEQMKGTKELIMEVWNIVDPLKQECLICKLVECICI